MLIRVVFLYYLLHIVTLKNSVAENTAIGDVNSVCSKEELLRIRLAVSNLNNRVLEQKNEICEIKTQISAAAQNAAETNVQNTDSIDTGLVRKLQELLVSQNTTLSRQAADIASLQQQLNESRNDVQNTDSIDTGLVRKLQELLVSQNTTLSRQAADIASLQQQLNESRNDVQNTGSIDTGLVRKLQELLATQNTTLSRQAADIASLQQQLNESRNARGTQVFYRWGRKDCPGNFSLVYTGYTGGSYFTNKGAAAEYTCMPSDPIWGPNKDKSSGNYAYMYGTEYEDPAFYKMADYKQDVPCAVCEARHVTTVIMIPGRTECYAGWTEAYHGDLTSGYYNHAAATQYVCVDQEPQALNTGGDVSNNGKMMFSVKAKCGALPCPPYEDNKALSCVVCVK